METSRVGPEEPLFYGILFGCALYLVWIAIRSFRQRKKRKLLLTHIQASIHRQEVLLNTLEQQIRHTLNTSYSQSWLDLAFQGRIFKDMPETLLQIALGRPDAVEYSGINQQTWRFNQGSGERLVVLLWNGKVMNWQLIQARDA